MFLEELRRRGFEEEPDGTLVRRREDVVERVDPRTLEVTAAIDHDTMLEKNAETTVQSGPRELEAMARSARRRLEAQLLEEGRARAELDLSVRVEAVGAALDCELEEVVARVYTEAVREKAESLGEVTAVSERRDGSEIVLELTVKVSSE